MVRVSLTVPFAGALPQIRCRTADGRAIVHGLRLGLFCFIQSHRPIKTFDSLVGGESRTVRISTLATQSTQIKAGSKGHRCGCGCAHKHAPFRSCGLLAWPRLRHVVGPRQDGGDGPGGGRPRECWCVRQRRQGRAGPSFLGLPRPRVI